jgi:hypothetical protein
MLTADGKKVTLVFRFAADDLVDDNGFPLEEEDYPWSNAISHLEKTCAKSGYRIIIRSEGNRQ